MIVSVGEHNYLAIPRGGIADLHLILCPIDCVPSRVHLSVEAKAEQQKFYTSIQSLFAAEHFAMLTFERAIRTKNSRDHVQVHFVPVSMSRINCVQTVFDELSAKHNIRFVEISAEQTVEEAVLTMDGGPYQEYFYVELPAGVKDDGSVFISKKVFVQEQDSSRFPMFFGNEVRFVF